MSVHVDHGTSVTQLREECYEIAIAGGGLVGMSLAVALGRAGISVALIEARGAQRQGDPGYDSRPIALSQSSRRILDTLGVWDSLAAIVTPITRIHVSDRGHFGFARLHAEDCSVDALGYVVAAAELGRSLEAALGSTDRVHVMRPAVVDDVDCNHSPGARLCIAAAGDPPAHGFPPRIEAKLMVLCDGGRSALRERLGDMQSRLGRLDDRAEKKRALVIEVMERAALKKLAEADFTASLRVGRPPIEVRMSPRSTPAVSAGLPAATPTT